MNRAFTKRLMAFSISAPASGLSAVVASQSAQPEGEGVAIDAVKLSSPAYSAVRRRALHEGWMDLTRVSHTSSSQGVLEMEGTLQRTVSQLRALCISRARVAG